MHGDRNVQENSKLIPHTYILLLIGCYKSSRENGDEEVE